MTKLEKLPQRMTTLNYEIARSIIDRYNGETFSDPKEASLWLRKQIEQALNRASENWQPIETVDRESKEDVELLTKYRLAYVGRYRAGQERCEPEPTIKAWRASCCGKFVTPTHFRKLKKP